ncbi:MAG: hypothetical protein OJF51_002682 [Nitrospira sp.]|jgi:hypothetical protein|nr:MAG: hypothetical protein OJF51_002682 [Nitrospira sp.]
MKDILLGSMLAAILLAYGAVVYGQGPDLYGHRRTNPAGSPDIMDSPNAHGGSGTSRVPSALPDSHIPPRSPDLGSPTFPLSPSIGPGSGLLGPESGPGPARLRSGHESEDMRRHFDRPAR